MNGLLLIDKPRGFTSHDVVAKVRGILRKASSQQLIVDSQKLTTDDSRPTTRIPKVRVGHTGTLDPMATGLLVLVVGSYTKRAAEFSKLDKVYEAELTLGATSTTGDAEGRIQNSEFRIQKPDPGTIKKALASFLGEIEQVPPAHSAIKIDGQRAYKLARAGKDVKMEPRQVTVHRLQVTDYEYPKLKLVAEVSSGTYIRSLASDIGEKLGTGAYLSALRRTQVGQYKIEQAKPLDKFKISDIVIT